MEKLSDTGVTDSRLRENDVVLPWKVACLLFRPHIIQRALAQGKGVAEISEMLARGERGEVVDEVKVILDEIINESSGKVTVRAGRDMEGPYVKEFSVELPKDGWGRSKPTEAGGLMIGPSSPLYGMRRIAEGTRSLLRSMSAEEIADMELQVEDSDYLLRPIKKVQDPK